MDRPTNGHRRHQTGSITVVDLIRRQQGPVRIPSALETDQRAEEADTVQFVEGLLGPDDDDDAIEHRGWLARGAKMAGLALGSLALCGSMVAAATLTHHRPPTAAPKTATTTVLTGVGALRPDTVAAQLAGQRVAAPTSPPGVASGRAVGTIVGSAPATTPPMTVQAPAPDHQNGAPSAAALVRAFYQLVRTDPSQASTLIDPTLLATDTDGFDQAWNSVSQIDIESIQQVSSDSVQAVIRLLQPDGTWIRAVELLNVTDGSSPLIDGAELLSAQRG
ncbi:MAG TPA: hypothetical protein VH333_19210 [Pseudonocardiaceae bacterium]|nr:hypothetical protein [Pseudonocardiaceae bacterium]